MKYFALREREFFLPYSREMLLAYFIKRYPVLFKFFGERNLLITVEDTIGE